MKILFVLHHAGVTPFARTLRLLAGRGHSIHLAFPRVKTAESHRDLQLLSTEFPGITFGELPGRRSSDWTPLARKLRDTSDYVRYLEPRYRDAEKLRARAREKAPVAGRRVARWVPTPVLKPTLALAERSLPPPSTVEQYLRANEYDLMLITPLIELGSGQSDWLRAANRVGVRTGYPVLSWDNLTNKGLLRDVPGRVFVWNEAQADEAVELHGVPRDRVRVTGAQPFDHWFEWTPSRTREELCAEAGLPPDRPFVLYLCSSGFVAPREPEFVRRWISELRARGVDAGILVRPHPLFASQWEGVDLGDPLAVVWPPRGDDPSLESGRRNYFDSIYHSAAVAGINTSAQIEAAIVGRPVHTVLTDDFRTTQEGTLHFHHLEQGLVVGRTWDEHAAQLAASLRGEHDDRGERFLHWFVRPLGLDVDASATLADAIEELGREPAPAPDPGPRLARPVRLALRPLARTALRRRDDRRRGDRKREHPEYHLRRRAQNMARHKTGSPAVFGPWLGDEVGELLYWIPYLRWAQTATTGLQGRMHVLRRRANAWWYEGIGTRQYDAEAVVPKDELGAFLGVEAERFLVLTWAEVEAARGALASHVPDRRIQKRLLEFAPLTLPEAPPEPAATIAAAERWVGPYGVETFVASLLGVPAFVLHGADDPDAERDLRLAGYFLDRPPFGRIEVEQLEAVNTR